MQIVAILAVLSLVNIIGFGVVVEQDLAHRAGNGSEYHASVEIEEVSTSEPGSLMEALSN